MIGNRLKILREEKDLKQGELAKILSVSPSTIGMYERNEREPNNLLTIKLAEYFNVTTDYLLGKSDIRNFDELNKMNKCVLDVQGLDDEILKIFQSLADYIKSKN